MAETCDLYCPDCGGVCDLEVGHDDAHRCPCGLWWYWNTEVEAVEEKAE